MSETYKPAASDEAVKAKTGKTWPEWFEILDAAGAAKLSHKEIVALLKQYPEVSAWYQQNITVEYERARGLRAQHQMTDGYQISASKTLPFTAAEIFEALQQEAFREQLFGHNNSSVKSATAPKVIRLNLPDKTIAEIRLTEKPNSKTQLTVQQSRLADAATADAKKVYWKELLNKEIWEELPVQL